MVAGTEVLLFDCGHGIPNRLAQVNRIGREQGLSHARPLGPYGGAAGALDEREYLVGSGQHAFVGLGSS